MSNPPYTHKPDGTPIKDDYDWVTDPISANLRFKPDITDPDVSDEGEEIECWNCEDRGWYVTVGDIRQACPDCVTGDLFFFHGA